MNKKYQTLIISPHCDDEVLGCGGVIYNRKDDDVFVYYLGVDDFHVISKEERIKEVQSVANFLNFEFKISNNPVNNFRKQDIIDLINQTQPDEVFIPNPSFNQDHKEVYEACLIALRPHDKNFFVKNVFVYEVDQYQTWAGSEFTPNYFEKIDLDKKIYAYKLHKSQVRAMRPPELIEKFCYIRGLSSNYDYAEGFFILRIIK